MRTLRSGFLSSVERYAEREALVIGDVRLTYRALDQRARRVAATLDRYAPAGGEKLTAVLAHRHPTAFAGILGALYRGHGYVPLNPTFPIERTRTMLQRSGSQALVVEPSAVEGLERLLEDAATMVVLLPDVDDVSRLRARWPHHTILGALDLAPADSCELGAVEADDLAYLLFTSGSTGGPKGVMVAHRNVTAFLDVMTARYGFAEDDRFSSTFDLTFDLSVFDLFCPWERGGCAVMPTVSQKLLPGRYVKDNRLSVWFSVPSTAVMMSRLRMLKPGAYPSLRLALFCGEALPTEIVERFREAAPNAILENLYGPTELTVACTHYRWDAALSPNECEYGLVPIGEPCPGLEARVVDEELRSVQPGEAGELVVAGPQVALGYWRDPERTARAFVRIPGEEGTFYRTGDRVRWPREGPLVYLGRMDNQIKVQGYRVELGEIEAVMRRVSGAESAVAVGWPRTASGADGIVGFVGVPDGDADAILEKVCGCLPGYMQPSTIRLVSMFPLNANGKIDRAALVRELGRQEKA